MEQEFSQGCIPREGQKTLIMHMQSPLTSRLGTVKVQAAQTWNQWSLSFIHLYKYSSSPEDRRRRKKSWAPPRGYTFPLTVSSSVERSWKIYLSSGEQLCRGYILVIHIVCTSELHILTCPIITKNEVWTVLFVQCLGKCLSRVSQ